MTPKERAAMEQALGALVRAEAMYGQPNADIQTALREALAEQAEPMTDTELINTNCRYTTPLMAEQAEQEPVAWIGLTLTEREDIREKYDGYTSSIVCATENILRKKNTTPIRTKDLTDDEIVKTAKWTGVFETKIGYEFGHGDLLDFARAVIAAYKEKNGL